MDVEARTQSAVEERVRDLPGEWTVLMNPDQSRVPEPLRPTRLDAIAVSAEGRGVVFEVVVAAKAGISSRRMAEIDRLRSAVGSIPGWEFDLIVLRPERGAPADEQFMRDALESAHEIAERAPVAAYLSAYSVLEWKLSVWVRRLKLNYAPNVQHLVSELITTGHLDDDIYPAVRRFQQLRNALAHGMRVDPPFGTNEVHSLFRFIDQLDDRVVQDREEVPGDDANSGSVTS
ncbi:hypothetical protein [Nocardia sp. NPDC005745]|uniref:hypothetical protein n=1 Tax=Nocardia sp. NPDC005745 TaxID=3157061 RepID=UPI0033DD235E